MDNAKSHSLASSEGGRLIETTPPEYLEGFPGAGPRKRGSEPRRAFRGRPSIIEEEAMQKRSKAITWVDESGTQEN